MVKWIGVGLVGLAGLAVAVAGVLYLVGRSRLGRTYEAPLALRAAPSDPAAVARGEHVVRIHGCQGCHGEKLEGRIFLDIPPGLLVASNLTRGRGGVGGRYTDQDWDRAVRFGIKPGGRWILPFMPYRFYSRLSDADAAAVVAYLKQLPPVDNELPPTRVRLPGYFMVALSDPDELRGELSGPRHPAPPSAPTAAYGAYLASTACAECHGDQLQGGKHPAPEAPPAPGLAHTGTWEPAAFARTVRTGVAPNGRRLNRWMPSEPQFRHLTDTEVAALHAYVRTLSGAPEGVPTGP